MMPHFLRPWPKKSPSFVLPLRWYKIQELRKSDAQNEPGPWTKPLLVGICIGKLAIGAIGRECGHEHGMNLGIPSKETTQNDL